MGASPGPKLRSNILGSTARVTIKRLQKQSTMRKEDLSLSYSARKALTVHLGESAGNEIASLLQRMAAQIEELKRNKVSVTQIIPNMSKMDPSIQALESETF